MSAELVVLVPSLGRAHMLATVRESLHDTAPGAEVLWLLTAGDPALDAPPRPGESRLVFPPRTRGDYAAKINAGVRLTGHPLMFLGANDIAFRDGWLDACLARLTGDVGVVGTNDGGNPRTATGDLSTHTLVTRDYARRGTVDNPNLLLHPGYWHEYVDDEFVQTAKARGAYAHATDALVEHLHPDHGKRPADDVDANRARRMTHGARLYRSRRHLWTQPLS